MDVQSVFHASTDVKSAGRPSQEQKNAARIFLAALSEASAHCSVSVHNGMQFNLQFQLLTGRRADGVELCADVV